MTNALKKVLIVEDDKDFLWILRQNFDHQDFSVVYALDGEEGLSLAQKEQPDLMVIDILLPNMDGITMAKKIKELGLNPKMIFLTNLHDPQKIGEVMSISADIDYMVKSDVHISTIVERVKNKLSLT